MDVKKRSSTTPRQFATSGTMMVRPLLLKPQWMNGLSERLLVSHYENNYGGALRRLNAIRARLATLDWARTPVFEINVSSVFPIPVDASAEIARRVADRLRSSPGPKRDASLGAPRSGLTDDTYRT